MQFALDDIERDSDGDGWTDIEEGRIGTNPHAPDSDGDGVPDGRDVCPLWPLPAATASDDNETILQRAVFAAFALTGSRQMLYVTPSTPRVHVRGYGGPIIFDRPLPSRGSSGGVYVSWRIRERSATDAVVEVTDWEGPARRRRTGCVSEKGPRTVDRGRGEGDVGVVGPSGLGTRRTGDWSSPSP